MADETLRFDIVGEDKVSAPFSVAAESAGKLSRAMDAAARQSAILDEALKRQGTAARTSVDATLTLARADKILEEAEHGLRDGALEAEFALKKQADAAKQAGRAADEAAAKNKALRESLKGLSINPGLAGPALLLAPALTTVAGVAAGAAVGIAGAFTAGAGALAAFGAVAKPVLASALTAEQAVQTAQDNYSAAIAGGTKQAVAYKAEQIAIGKAYAELSPAQIALSRQLGAMSDAWAKVKAAQTPVVAGALQPWLKSVTDLTSKLGPIIAAVSPVIGQLGTQFDTLINSPQFTAFRDFIANTGSQAVGAIGGTLIDFIDAGITLLPQFNPLIEKAVGWIANLGPAVKTWASSQNTADNITKFMVWFSNNGPVVGGLLKNIGGALKALAPGLSAGGTTELKVISDFFGWVAKLPPAFAKPLADVAGTLLILNKLGVFSVGVKFVGLAAGWIAKLLGGGAGAEIGGATAAAEIRAAFATGGAAAAAEIRAAMTGAAVPGAAGGAAGRGAAGAGGAAAGAGLGLGTVVLSAAAIGIAIGEIFSKITTGKFEDFTQWKAKFLASIDSVRHAFASFGAGVVQDWNLVWANTITRTAKGFHDLAGWFDTGRHWVAATTQQTGTDIVNWWNTAWNNTITRAAKGLHDTAAIFDQLRHSVATYLDQIRAGAVLAWNGLWADTITRAANGVRTLGTWWHNLQTGAVTAFGIVRTSIASAWNLIWSDTVTKVTTGISKVVTFFQGLPGKITSALSSLGTTLANIGKGAMSSLLSGFTSVAGSILSWLGNFAKSVLNAIGSVFGIHFSEPSLSTVFHKVGAQIMQSMINGIEAKTNAAVSKASAAASAVSGALGSGGVSNASGVAALKSAAAKHGWTSAAEWNALNAVEMREAGYSLTATNRKSGAYGMAQFINGPSEYAQYGGNSTTYAGQATAMANYISARYGDPIAAWAHEQAYGWYGSGLDAMFSRPTLIGVGERGPERVQVTPGHGGAGMSAGEQAIVAALADLSRRVDNLTGVTASVPRATGQHVGAAIGGAAHDASFRSRYH